MAGPVVYRTAPDRALVDGLMVDLQRTTDALKDALDQDGRRARGLRTGDLDRVDAALQAASVSICLDQMMTRIGISMRRARNQKMALHRGKTRKRP